MTDSVEKRILYLSRSIALMRDLTGYLSQGDRPNYGRETHDSLDKLVANLDRIVIMFDELRDEYALDMMEIDENQPSISQGEIGVMPKD